MNLKSTRFFLLFLIALGIFFCKPISGQDLPKPLRLGDKAPPVKVDAWIKGSGIDSFDQGMVYVIDFGFISCAPCRAAIPHLSELAVKYEGRVKVISIFTSKDTPKMVRELMKQIGESVKYDVAVDSTLANKERFMENAWVKAAGLNGYPSVFIVGESGNVEYIGQNAYLLDESIESLLSDEVIDSKESERNKLLLKINSANAGDYYWALQSIDSLIELEPNNKGHILDKVKLMLKYNPIKAYEYGWQFLGENSWNEQGDPDFLHKIALHYADGKYRRNGDKLVRAIRFKILEHVDNWNLELLTYEALAYSYYRHQLFDSGAYFMDKAIALNEIHDQEYSKHNLKFYKEIYYQKFAHSVPEIEKSITDVESKDFSKRLGELDELVNDNPGHVYLIYLKIRFLKSHNISLMISYCQDVLASRDWSGSEHWLIWIASRLMPYKDLSQIIKSYVNKVISISEDNVLKAEAYRVLSWLEYLSGSDVKGKDFMKKSMALITGERFGQRRRNYEEFHSYLKNLYAKRKDIE